MSSDRFPWVAMLVLAGLTGCAMCDNSQDCTYPAFGGKWQRDNPSSGRVASVFDPAGTRMIQEISPAEEVPTPTEAGTEAESVEAAEDAETSEDATEPLVVEPPEQDSGMADEAETTQEQEGAKAEPSGQAEPPVGQDTPESIFQFPGMPDEKPRRERPKGGGTNLLPTPELPPES